MGFWIFMLLSDAIIPGIMIGFGWWFGAHPPKKINYFCGYRTKMAMKNQDTWDFAHRKSGEIWFRWGRWTLLTLIPMLFALGKSPDVIGTVSLSVMLVQLVPLLGSIWPVEKALRETFDRDGRRKAV